MLRHGIEIGFLVAFVSVFAGRGTGCAFCERLSQQQLQLRQLQQLSQQQPQQQGYRTIGSPRPFGAEKPTRVQEFNRTGVLHPEYQIPATIRPGNVSQFYYLSPREGPPLTLLVSPCSGPISWTVSYVEPPENTEETEGSKSQTRWPVKTLKPGSPLFTYKGAEDQNFTIPKTRAGLYWFEIKAVDPPDDNLQKLTPSTVLLYATSSELDHISEWYMNDTETRHRPFKFQQRRSKRRLTISWNKRPPPFALLFGCHVGISGSPVDPLRGAECSACSSTPGEKKFIVQGATTARDSGRTPLRASNEIDAPQDEVNTRNNVSNRVATDMIKFRKTPELMLRTGRYTTASLRKTDGLVNFRYRPPENVSSTFHILPCGGGIVRAKVFGPGILREKAVVGYASLRVPPLTSGKTYTLRISASTQELARVFAIKVLATQESSTIFPQIPSSTPREYRSLRTCHEVTIGVESAGAAKYCILGRELRSASSLASVTTNPDQCNLHPRRRSEYTFEVCEEKQNAPKDRALPFTLKRLQPGKAYVLQITAQVKDQSFSYPLLGVRTRRSCPP
ncbi:neuron derived neurotrophic factor nord isoform X2 [Ptiloglossa arizonensis]|uniref:neuron derived neurotrophic factor nord isoform X2 n=1 Tax=Ptiloglossa arizonensis TaxID=3350558 RepID=UPI003F9FA992